MAEKPMTPSEQMEFLQKLASHYGEKGEDALEKDILASVKKEREAGRLTDAMIMSMVNNISRFLSAEQKNRLDALVKKIIEPKAE